MILAQEPHRAANCSAVYRRITHDTKVRHFDAREHTQADVWHPSQHELQCLVELALFNIATPGYVSLGYTGAQQRARQILLLVVIAQAFAHPDDPVRRDLALLRASGFDGDRTLGNHSCFPVLCRRDGFTIVLKGCINIIMTENNTRMLYLIKLIEVVESLGYDSGDIRHSAGLSLVDLDDCDGSLAISDYVAAIRAATALCQTPDLGFRVGIHTKLVEHGVLGYALLSAVTLRDSLARYVRYQFLQGPLLSIEFNTDGDNATLIAQPIANYIGECETVQRYILQEWLIGWNQWSTLVGTRGAFFNHVTLGLSDQENLDVWSRYLGCPVVANGDATVATFPHEYLARPLNFSDQAVAALCDEQCERILEQLDLGHGLVAEIHRLLAATPGTVPIMETVAKRLFVDVRTLRRRLLNEDTTYQKVVTDFRLALAKRYLTETTLPANEIAILVGYADPANLYRVIRRSLQMTPKQLRVDSVR